MSYFEPQPEFANELELLLMTAASGGDNTNRQQALSTIEGYKSNPDFFRYCAFILSNPNPVSGVDATFVRQLAAFQIKNGLRHPNCRGLLEVRQLTIAALGDQNRRVRKAAGGILATAVMHGIWNARSVMGELVDGLNQGDESLPGYLAAIAEVVEENIEPLDVESDSGAALTPTIAAFILPYLGHENVDVQKDALVIVDVLLEQAALRREGPAFEALRGSVNDLLTYVAGILQNPEAPPKFVGLAIQCLYYTLAYADSVAHLVPSMTDMMTGLAGHPSEEVRTEVVMFFAAIVGAEMTGLISDYIPAVLQYLLDSLVFSEMELEMLAATEGDAGEPDRPEDVRPKIFQHGAKRAGGDDDDEDGDMDVDQWNLRVASGQTLDAFARAIGDEVLSHILDPLAQRLNNGNDWRTQESAVMAVGVLAGTCQGLNDYLPDIMNTIFTLLESPSHFLVKCMCCWALEQNAEWLMTSDASLSNGYLGRAITNICQCMQSNTKILQTRATSALGGFAATAEGEELHPFAVEIVETLANCFANYQLKNVYILFENVDAVYKCFGRRLAEEDVITTVMTPLQNLWATLGNESPVIFPFFMALGSAASAIGSAIEPMATEIFTRGVGLAEHHQLARQYATQADEDMPDFSTEFLIAALDLLSGLANALGSGITPYLQELGETRTMQLIMTAAADPIADVRQSAFGLMGELCSGCIGFMQGNWGVFAPLILNGISDLDELEVASNAAWTLGEFLANYLDGQGYPAFEQQHSDGFMSRLASLLALEFNADLRNLWENVAIAIGRLLTYDPDAAYRTQLDAWQPGWALSMSNMPNCPQKEAALRGVLNVWMNDAGVVTSCLKAFLDTMTSLPNNMPNDLKTQLTAFIELVKQGYGQEQWGQIMSQYTPQMRDKLRRMYRVQ